MSAFLFAAANMHLNTNLGPTQYIVNSFLKRYFLAIMLLLYAVDISKIPAERKKH